MPFKVAGIEPRQGLKPKVQELLELVGLNPVALEPFPTCSFQVVNVNVLVSPAPLRVKSKNY
jgi:hypothetical protein